MYEIHTMDMEFERCAKNKEHINAIIPYTVFHFVLSGEGIVNGNRISENTVFISYNETPMNYYPSENNPWSYVYVRLLGKDLKKVFSDYDFNFGLTILPFTKEKELFNILSLYGSLCNYNDYEARKAIANTFLLLFDKKSLPADADGLQKQHAGNIKSFIDENYYKKITVKSIADKFYLSKDYVRNLFIKFYGTSPKNYIQNVRMERAKELLLTTETSIKVVAGSVGYDDALLFSKMFKKYYNVSPKKYRSGELT